MGDWEVELFPLSEIKDERGYSRTSDKITTRRSLTVAKFFSQGECDFDYEACNSF